MLRESEIFCVVLRCVVGMLVRTNGSYSVVRDAYLSTTSSTSFVRVHASSSTGGLMKERVNE